MKNIIVALDAFTSTAAPAKRLPGFDETRLAVTP